ncbi:hypothetical protein IWX90DRAFT_170615 [Phyllosticta citrichinensis]|uniref:Uncharacterized protein n=1 Tax=Phyllosticta citrichinensis TaxID=1130410 RepID=A0ABR1Y176_9PEZI
MTATRRIGNVTIAAKRGRHGGEGESESEHLRWITARRPSEARCFVSSPPFVPAMYPTGRALKWPRSASAEKEHGHAENWQKNRKHLERALRAPAGYQRRRRVLCPRRLALLLPLVGGWHGPRSLIARSRVKRYARLTRLTETESPPTILRKEEKDKEDSGFFMRVCASVSWRGGSPGLLAQTTDGAARLGSYRCQTFEVLRARVSSTCSLFSRRLPPC